MNHGGDDGNDDDGDDDDEDDDDDVHGYSRRPLQVFIPRAGATTSDCRKTTS